MKKDEEALRRVTNVKELKGKLNSQKDEQFHAAYNHDSWYLNQMKAVNHIFLFRLNIDIDIDIDKPDWSQHRTQTVIRRKRTSCHRQNKATSVT